MASKTSHIRSNSFPSRSHPITLRVEEALNQINSSALSSSESICNGICSLAELYQSMDDLLNLPSTIQALSVGGEEFLDGSVRILDVCGLVKEIVSQLKANVRDVQSSLRRGKGDSSMNNYACFRKKMKKDAKKSLAALKQIDREGLPNDDQNISSVLREVTSTSITVFQSVLIFLSSKPKSISKWSLVSRLVKQGKYDQESQNELESVDSALKTGNIESIQKGLVTLEATIDGVEKELEGLFRCLIKSRTSLLNICSC